MIRPSMILDNVNQPSKQSDIEVYSQIQSDISPQNQSKKGEGQMKFNQSINMSQVTEYKAKFD